MTKRPFFAHMLRIFAVPIIIACLEVNAVGSETSQSPLTRAFCASPPQ